MKLQLRVALITLSLLGIVDGSMASIEDIGGAQGEYERSIEAVVRNKRFYKAGHFELGVAGGTLPYDSVVSHLSVGGRLTWHITDHYGWEILDGQFLIPTITNFTRNTTETFRIKRLDALELKMMVSSNFVVSPLYGKIRLLGSQVIYFDIYAVLGVGAAQGKTSSFSYASSTSPVVQTQIRSAWDPMFNIGLGIKIFATRAFGVTIDLRDYVVSTELYGSRSLVSNFAVQGGLTFFLPSY